MQWLKLEFMKTPGYMRVNISLLTILMISSVSSTVLQITRMGENTLDVSTSGSLEHLNGVLTESLDDGTPKYYNSNILSRYFRKDYYEGLI